MHSISPALLKPPVTLINKDNLADSFMNALDKLDLLVDSDVSEKYNSNIFLADPQNEEDSELEL